MKHEEFLAMWVRQYRTAQKRTYRTPTDLVKEMSKTQIALETDRARVLGDAIHTLYGKHPLDIVTLATVLQEKESVTVAQLAEALL